MKKLTDTERLVLGEFEFAPDQSVDEAASRLDCKVSSVYYTLRKMETRGAISLQPFIDPYRLGYQDIGIFFKLSPVDDTIRNKVVASIVAHEQTVWFGALAGDYNFGITLLVKNITDLQSFFENISGVCDTFFASKVIVHRLRTTIYSRKYLRSGQELTKRLTFSREPELSPIDTLDRKLLTILAATPYRSLRDVARTSETPLTTVERRLRRLADIGVYQGLYYAITPRVLGVTFYRILFSLTGVTTALRDSFEMFCSRHRNVTFLVDSIGPWDFEVGCEVADTSELPLILEQLAQALDRKLVSADVLTEVKDYKFAPFPFKEGRQNLPRRDKFEVV